MSKMRVFDLQLVATLLVIFASRLVSESAVLSSWWLAIGAGTFAMLLSRARTATVIASVLAFGTAVVTLMNASTVLSADSGPLALGLLAVANVAQALTVRGLATTSQGWKSAAKYEAQPANPWNSVDQGIDPTL